MYSRRNTCYAADVGGIGDAEEAEQAEYLTKVVTAKLFPSMRSTKNFSFTSSEYLFPRHCLFSIYR